MSGDLPVFEQRDTLEARVAGLTEVLSDPEVLELSSLLDCMARAHNITWGWR
jgi:hypothetical protein